MASKLKGRQSEVFAKVAAINTLLDRYPVLTTTDSMLTSFSVNTSIGFLLSLLEIFGVSQADIVNWICQIVGDEDDGVLEIIEWTIKGILMSNIKGVFSCDFNPILPDNLMKYVIDDGSGRQDPSADFPHDPTKKNKIEINIQSVDLFGLLANCPSNKKGGVFYFDAYDPKTTSVIDDVVIEEPHYIPNELYKSRDFNAFLWYVINKGNIGNHTDLQKNTWDNRNKVYKKWKNLSPITSQAVEENFFKSVPSGTTYANKPRIPITNGNTYSSGNVVCNKEQYIICQYTERGSNQAYSNVLNVWLNADRYYRTRKFKTPVGKNATGGTEYHEYAINKTVFEFNYDYIYSLKLFDTKTLLANIVNSILGLGASFSYSFSIEQKQAQKRVEEIVEKIMSQSDTEVADDCYYKFDNAAYQQMIDEVTKSYTGSYVDPLVPSNNKYGDIYDALGAIGDNPEKTGQSDLLKRVIEATAYEAQGASGVTGGVEISMNHKIGADFIMDFVKQTVVQIVLQVLSPKVGILFAINSQILGDVGDLNDWENFLKNFDNLIKNIIESVKDIIVKELYNFMMKQLKPLLELLIHKLALETIKYYKELIQNLILNCIPYFKFGSDGLNTQIDNVNYADIIVNEDKQQKDPELPC